jgi:DNA-binding HxlR family transcriptional regulator
MRNVYTPQQINQTKHIVTIIGDAHHVLVLYELMNFGEKSFNELKRMTDINAVTLSKKLSRLKELDLVTCRKVGIEKRYSLTPKAYQFEPLIKDIEQLVINA